MVEEERRESCSSNISFDLRFHLRSKHLIAIGFSGYQEVKEMMN